MSAQGAVPIASATIAATAIDRTEQGRLQVLHLADTAWTNPPEPSGEARQFTVQVDEPPQWVSDLLVATIRRALANKEVRKAGPDGLQADGMVR